MRQSERAPVAAAATAAVALHRCTTRWTQCAPAAVAGTAAAPSRYNTSACATRSATYRRSAHLRFQDRQQGFHHLLALRLCHPASKLVDNNLELHIGLHPALREAPRARGKALAERFGAVACGPELKDALRTDGRRASCKSAHAGGAQCCGTRSAQALWQRPGLCSKQRGATCGKVPVSAHRCQQSAACTALLWLLHNNNSMLCRPNIAQRDAAVHLEKYCLCCNIARRRIAHWRQNAQRRVDAVTW